ncbi:unnamed protein product [Blepharisma stoltei]|uniref:Uncharacterized protein n=1 Tax=Blepharisma stoltei TaxID=1481888 RepID=A0AAU9IXS5_9CILI|nr:unnamed protein product [Blepharisma stoltei]
MEFGHLSPDNAHSPNKHYKIKREFRTSTPSPRVENANIKQITSRIKRKSHSPSMQISGEFESPHRKSLLLNLDYFRKTFQNERNCSSNVFKRRKHNSIVDRLKSYNLLFQDEEKDTTPTTPDVSIKQLHKKLMLSHHIPKSPIGKRTDELMSRLKEDYLKNKEELHKRLVTSLPKSVKSFNMQHQQKKFKPKF